jgi:hypothetical protein
MEQVLAGGLGLILLLVGIVATVTVGVMAILLPFFVFRILSHVAEMNRKMSKIVDLLGNESRQGHRQPPAVGGQLEPTVRGNSGPAGGDVKPFRFR